MRRPWGIPVLPGSQDERSNDVMIRAWDLYDALMTLEIEASDAGVRTIDALHLAGQFAHDFGPRPMT